MALRVVFETEGKLILFGDSFLIAAEGPELADQVARLRDQLARTSQPAPPVLPTRRVAPVELRRH